MRISDWSSDVCSSDLLNDLTRSIDFALSNAERGTSVAGAADAGNANICQTRILTKGIEQLRDLREEVLRQRAQMRQSYMASRSEEHTSELQSLMRISYAVFCLKKKKIHSLPLKNTQKPSTQTNTT